MRKLRDLAFPPPDMDFDNPYAVDMDTVFAHYAELKRLTASWSPRQVRETSLELVCLRMEEAFRMHAKAIGAQDWAGVDFTFRQLKAVWREYNDRRFKKVYDTVVRLDARRRAGRKARGAKRGNGKDWDAICRDYDQWMADGVARALVVQRLARTCDTSKQVINRGLRVRARGARNETPTSPTKT